MKRRRAKAETIMSIAKMILPKIIEVRATATVIMPTAQNQSEERSLCSYS